MSMDDIEYPGPTGRELPGEHWNARILRELAEAAAARAAEQVWTGGPQDEGLEPVVDKALLAGRDTRVDLDPGWPLLQHAELKSLAEALRERGYP